MAWLRYYPVTFGEDRLHVCVIHSIYPNIQHIHRLTVGQRCLWILVLPTRKREMSPGHGIKTCVLVVFPKWLFIYKEQNWTNTKECICVFLTQSRRESMIPSRQMQEAPSVLNGRGWGKSQISQGILVVAYIKINSYFVTLFFCSQPVIPSFYLSVNVPVHLNLKYN